MFTWFCHLTVNLVSCIAFPVLDAPCMATKGLLDDIIKRLILGERNHFFLLNDTHISYFQSRDPLYKKVPFDL